ncbi:MAG: hypothetical protein JW737_02530 [Acidobacteria bacterium]|nr:hypothetical protein [Acidobacteriota bacterium]
MKKAYKEKIIDYLYGEMTKTEKKEFEKEIKNSDVLEHKVEELKNLRFFFNEFKDFEAPDFYLDRAAIYNNISSQDSGFSLRRIPLLGKAAIVLVAFFLVLSVLRTTVVLNDDGFKISFGSSIADAGGEKAAGINNQMIIDEIKKYIDDKDNSQRMHVGKLVDELDKRNDVRRRMELQAIYKDIESLKINTQARFLGTEVTLNGIINYIYKQDNIKTVQNAGGI